MRAASPSTLSFLTHTSALRPAQVSSMRRLGHHGMASLHGSLGGAGEHARDCASCPRAPEPRAST